ncbi:MAG TPA: Gfo/Idh/MocA family oxidoreductase [Kofleriaceae bacterium]|nr:Gfo/Idh/MocA family oxidoreductase [Kofleriaceae bacterium]
MSKLRVGIAGYGIVGQRRRRCIDEHPALEVVGVCDRMFEADERTEGGVAYFQRYQRLVDLGLDVLYVCLPNDVAPEATIAGLEAGAHVFCEKPPGRTVADIKQVRAAEARHPTQKLKYGFNHRYHASVQEALKLAQGGALGRVINMRGVYGKSAFNPWPREKNGWRTNRAIAGGGILLDQGIHMVDLMRLFGGEFHDVKSFVSNSTWDLDVEDNAYALMRSDRGVVALLHSTATQWRHRFKLEVFLERGALILSGILSGSKSYGQEALTIVYREDEANGNPRETTSTYIRDNSWSDEVAELTACILEDRPVEVGHSLDALRTMELIYRIYCADPEWRERYHLTMD